MNLWRWLARQFPDAPRGARAHKALAGAYRRVLMPGATASDADKEIVLADLANFSGFYRVNGMGVADSDRAVADGMRATYGRIHRFLRLTGDELASLEEAARQEALIDAREGE